MDKKKILNRLSDAVMAVANIRRSIRRIDDELDNLENGLDSLQREIEDDEEEETKNE
jgi:uncharacterized coiled-coil protein SlyX